MLRCDRTFLLLVSAAFYRNAFSRVSLKYAVRQLQNTFRRVPASFSSCASILCGEWAFARPGAAAAFSTRGVSLDGISTGRWKGMRRYTFD